MIIFQFLGSGTSVCLLDHTRSVKQHRVKSAAVAKVGALIKGIAKTEVCPEKPLMLGF